MTARNFLSTDLAGDVPHHTCGYQGRETRIKTAGEGGKLANKHPRITWWGFFFCVTLLLLRFEALHASGSGVGVRKVHKAFGVLKC